MFFFIVVFQQFSFFSLDEINLTTWFIDCF